MPQRSPSLAHVVPNATLDLRQYTAALDDPSLPLVDMRWRSLRAASIDTTLHAGQAVSVQTCYHPGWRATANGSPPEIRRDTRGFLSIHGRFEAPCRIELTYDGGWEYKLARGVSLLTILGLIAYATYHARHIRPYRSAPG